MPSTVVIEEQLVVLELILPEDVLPAHSPWGYMVTSTKVVEEQLVVPELILPEDM